MKTNNKSNKGYKMAKDSKVASSTSNNTTSNEPSLDSIFGDSVIVEQSTTTTKTKSSSEPLEMARQEIKLASQSIMKKYGKHCSFVTTIPCGKDDKGQQLRKKVVQSGYFIPCKVNDTKLGITYYEMKSNGLATTFETSKTPKYMELED